MKIRRRSFLQGCCAGIIAMNGSRLGNLVFADPKAPGPRDTIITLYLRGGVDALNFLVPYADSDYQIGRARLKLTGAQVIQLSGQFGLHPSATGLKGIYDMGHLAAVCATGSPDPTRSHFEAQDYMERGVALQSGYNGGGWLTRYLDGVPGDSVFKAISQGSSVALSLEGYPGALSLSGADGFTLNGRSTDDIRRSLRTMYAGDPDLSAVAARTLDATDVIDWANPDDYTPENGVTYANTSISNSFASLAQLLKLDVGLAAATVDYGGWDTHENQASGSNSATGTFATRVGEVSDALNAFWRDIASYHGKVTIVVMTEFGRRLKENDNIGTDHGHGSFMLVISSNVTQAKVYGTWPGLAYEQLFEHVDLAVTTDYRTVLSDILLARLNYTEVETLFPGYTYAGPTGIFTMPDRTPVGNNQGFVLR